MSRKTELARMTFREAEQVDRSRAILLLPMGVLEQHGPGIPMGVDYVFAERVALQAAERFDDVYVAPTINYGYSPTFQNFPGNLGLPFDVFAAHLRAVVERLIACGWRNIVYVNSHAGNEPACEVVAREMRAKYGTTMAHLFPYRIANLFGKELLKEPKTSMGHGGSQTASIALALFGDDVRTDWLEAPTKRPLPGFEASTGGASTLNGFAVGLYVDTEDVAPNGVSGNPVETSLAVGEGMVACVVDYCVAFLPKYRDLVNTHLDERGHYRG